MLFLSIEFDLLYFTLSSVIPLSELCPVAMMSVAIGWVWKQTALLTLMLAFNFVLHLPLIGFKISSTSCSEIAPISKRLRSRQLKMAPSSEEGWMISHFSIVQVHLFFVNCISIFDKLFPFLIKYYHIMFINLFSLGSDRLSRLLFPYPLYFFPFSLFSSSLLILFLCLISFLLFPWADVWKTLVHEYNISYTHTDWYLPFSRAK